MRCTYRGTAGTSGGAMTSRQPGHFQVTKVVRQVMRCKRQHSKGARSFRGQKILKPGHRMHFFPQKNVDDFFLVALKTQTTNAADCFTVKRSFKAVRYGDNFLFSKQSKAVAFSARSFPWCSAATDWDESSFPRQSSVGACVRVATRRA